MHINSFEEFSKQYLGDDTKQLRNKFPGAYYRGLMALDDWYGDKAYRQYDDWLDIIDVVVKQTISQLSCSFCGQIFDTIEIDACPNCSISNNIGNEIK